MSPVVQHIVFLKYFFNEKRRVFSRVNDFYGLSYGFAYTLLEERIMCAAKKQSVYAAAHELIQIYLSRKPCHIVVVPAFLGKRNKKGTGLGKYLDGTVSLVDKPAVHIAPDRGFRADNADLFVDSRAYGAFYSRLHNADKGNVKFRPESLERVGRDGIAGGNDRFYVFCEKKTHYLLGVFSNDFR